MTGLTAAHPFLDRPGPIPFAHRGGAAEAAENSWGAFERAVALGYTYMETDVRVTADGVALAFHDRDLLRLTRQRGLVSDTPWDQVKGLTLGPGGDAGPIPRLEELLGSWPWLHWNIDVKVATAVAPVAEAVSRTNSLDRVLVASFSAARTAAVKRLLGPGLATGAGRTAIATLVAAKRAPVLGRAVRRAPLAAQVPMARRGVPIVDAAFIRACHRAGIAVHVWTVDKKEDVEVLLDLGVDGIMTDRPTMLKEVLEARGRWA